MSGRFGGDVPPLLQRLRRTAPDDGATARSNRPAIITSAVAIAMLVVSTFLPWTYNPAILDDLTVLGYPSPTQLMLVALAVFAAGLVALRLPRADRWRRLFGRQSGLRRLSVGILAFVVLVALIIVLGMGKMTFSLGGMRLEGIGLAGVAGVLLNFVLPHPRRRRDAEPAEDADDMAQ